MSVAAQPAAFRRRRSTGAIAGLTILLLGVWGGLIPFVGPYFHFGFRPDTPWHFTWERLYLDVIPGIAAVVGGAILVVTARGATAVVGGLLAAGAGVWFAIGVPLSTLWQGTGRFGIGAPLGGHAHQALEWVGFFYGLGAAIAFLAGVGMGRLSMGSKPVARPVEHAPEPVAPTAQYTQEHHSQARIPDGDESSEQAADEPRQAPTPESRRTRASGTAHDNSTERPASLPEEW